MATTLVPMSWICKKKPPTLLAKKEARIALVKVNVERKNLFARRSVLRTKLEHIQKELEELDKLLGDVRTYCRKANPLDLKTVSRLLAIEDGAELRNRIRVLAASYEVAEGTVYRWLDSFIEWNQRKRLEYETW